MKYIALIVTLLFSVWVNPAAAQSADVVEVKVKGLVCYLRPRGREAVERLWRPKPRDKTIQADRLPNRCVKKRTDRRIDS